MRRLLQWPMTAMWVAMGLLVTLGFWNTARQHQERCEASNQFRRHDLPAAFNAYSDFLGDELDAPPERIEDAKARFAVVLDRLFPERDCDLGP